MDNKLTDNLIFNSLKPDFAEEDAGSTGSDWEELGTSTVNRIGTVDQNRGFARRLFIRGSVRTVTVHPR